MSENPLVSIVTAVYNGSEYLEDLIESVLSQDYPQLEHIVIDDGSDDGGATRAILERYGHLRWWSRENQGQYPTQNEGIAAARGDIIGVICADDRYTTPDAVRTAVEFLGDHPEHDCVFGRVLDIDGNGALVAPQTRLSGKWAPYLLPVYLFIPHCGLFVRRTGLERLSGPFDVSYSYAGDWDWALTLRDTGARFGYVDHLMAFYRTHPAQTGYTVGEARLREENRRVCSKHGLSYQGFRTAVLVVNARSLVLKGWEVCKARGKRQALSAVLQWLRSKWRHAHPPGAPIGQLEEPPSSVVVDANRVGPAMVAQYEHEKRLARLLADSQQGERRQMYGKVYDEFLPARRAAPPVKTANEVSRSIAAGLALLNRYVSPTTSFLEIGAGDGSLASALAAFVQRAYALEVTTQPEASRAHHDLVTLKYDGVDIPATVTGIDVAYSNQVIEHLHPEDLPIHLRGVFNALAPTGLYVCVTPNRLSGPHDVSRFFGAKRAEGLHIMEYGCAELAASCRRAGFSDVRAVAGGGGRFFEVPVIVVLGMEVLLRGVPRPLARQLMSTRLVRGVLGVRIVARKACSRDTHRRPSHRARPH